MTGVFSHREWARDWLFSAALPLWWDAGADHIYGGWWDKLDQRGNALPLPKRLRVQARQTFVYAEGGRLGWDGPWRDAVMHGLDYILGRFRRPDGLFRASVSPDGTPLVETPDLYDQAFVLFALASCFESLGRPTAVLEEAYQLLDRLATLLGHPERGFEEARPRTLPLRSNPHMHLLEALLAWCELGVGEPFVTHANVLVDLAIDRLIDPVTGAVGEYYDGDWRFHPVNGHLREPGHQFEWAFLMFQAGKILNTRSHEVVHRLHSFGSKYGIREKRVIFSVSSDGQLIDGSSRLWAQTERLRAMLLLAPNMAPADRVAANAATKDAIAVLQEMLQTPIAGLWYDRMSDDGSVLDEASPASSLYHIVTGISPLISSNEDSGTDRMRSSSEIFVGSAS